MIAGPTVDRPVTVLGFSVGDIVIANGRERRIEQFARDSERLGVEAALALTETVDEGRVLRGWLKVKLFRAVTR